MHQPIVNQMSLNNAHIQQPKRWSLNPVGCNAVLSGMNLALRRNAPPPLSGQNMHYIQSKCHLFTTLHESGPKDLRSRSRVNVKSYKIMHRPLKRNHASLLAKRIWGLTLHHVLRKLPVRKIYFCFTIYFAEFVNHSFLKRIYMQQLYWSSY